MVSTYKLAGSVTNQQGVVWEVHNVWRVVILYCCFIRQALICTWTLGSY